MRKINIFISSFILIGFFGGIFYFIYYKDKNIIESGTFTERPKNQKICPDAWIDNQMPIVGGAPISSRYFIVNGEHWEYEYIDAEWVKETCSVSEPIRVF